MSFVEKYGQKRGAPARSTIASIIIVTAALRPSFIHRPSRRINILDTFARVSYEEGGSEQGKGMNNKIYCMDKYATKYITKNWVDCGGKVHRPLSNEQFSTNRNV